MFGLVRKERGSPVKMFVSWSGGKDSALACYRMANKPGVEIAFLLNMLTEKGECSCSHRLSVALLREQARAMGIPIVQRKASRDDYEKEFKRAIVEVKQHGVQGGIFGDIDLQPHRDWIERVCRDMDIEAFFPLWDEKRETLLEALITAGFKSQIVVTEVASLGKKWLGCEIDRNFMRAIKVLPHIDPCGEKGEYHTFVYAGPLFKTPVLFHEEGRSMIEKHWVLKLGAGVRQGVPG